MYNDSALGKPTVYLDQYNPELLFKIRRSDKRSFTDLPFVGYDIWNGYEFSWLDLHGMPQARFIRVVIPCESEFLIESKSLKLYLYSFANTKFASIDAVVATISKDLGAKVELYSIDNPTMIHARFAGVCLDDLDVSCTQYDVFPDYLVCNNTPVQESLYSNLLKANCLVTGQPDWASVAIAYKGEQIDHKGLLQYIVSYRDHLGFHEHCVEQIFVDIMQRCKPQDLQVVARFTRRGGLDINPVRATSLDYTDFRLFRQ